MMGRHVLEMVSRAAAGVIEETEKFQWVRVLDRFNMYVMKGDKSVSPHLVNDGFWESWITQWVINNVDDDTLFIDVGANTGYYSFLAAHQRAAVVAFEPNPNYLGMIYSTIQRTHDKSLFLLDYALSDYTGEAVLNVPLELHGSASLNDISPKFETTKVEVKVVPLDDVQLKSDRRKTILKIDAEGEEERILRGARDFIAGTENLTVLLEYTPEAYSHRFLPDLFNQWNVSAVTFNGDEELVPREWIEAQDDWVMLVLRPKS